RQPARRLTPAERTPTLARPPAFTDRPGPPGQARLSRLSRPRNGQPRSPPENLAGFLLERARRDPGALFKPPRGTPCSHPQQPHQNPSRSVLPLLGAEHLAAVTPP